MSRTNRILLAFFAASIAVGWLCFDERLSRLGDNAEFIVISKSLVTGHGMSFVHGPEPEPARKFPPGYPGILAITQLISPDDINLMKSVSVFFFALTVPLVWLVIREIDTEWAATIIAVTALASPHLIEYSHQVLSEIPYCAFSLAMILALLRYRESDDNKKLLIVICLAVASYYIRTVGLTAIGAVVCTHFLDRRYRQGFLLGIVATFLILPWVLSSSAYLDQLSSINPYKTETDPGVGVGELVERVSTNLQRYGLMFLPHTFVPLGGFIDTPGLHIDLLALVIDLLFVYFIVMTLRRSRKEAPLAVYLSLFMIVVLLWPSIWSDTRFLIPIIPLAIYGLFWSVRDLVRRLPVPETAKTYVPFVAAALVLLANVSRTAATQVDHPPYNAGWRNYFDSAEWIRDNTPEDVLVVCRKPFLMNVISGRKTMGYPWIDPRALVDSLDSAQADVVVSDALFSTTRQYLNRAILGYPESFLQMAMLRESGTVVFEFLGYDRDGNLATLARKRRELEAHLENVPADITRWNQLYEIGTVYHRKNRIGKALEIYEAVVPHMGHLAVVWHNIGIIHYTEGRYSESVAAYQEAVKRGPKNARAKLGLAQAYEAAGDYRASIGAAREVLQIDSNSALAHHTIARSAMALDQDEQAEASFKAALQLEPNSLQIGNDLASLLLKRGKAADAYALLKQMVDQNPTQPALRLNLVSSLTTLDRLDEARQHLNHLLQNHAQQISEGPLSAVTRGVMRMLANKLGTTPEALVAEAGGK